MEDIVCLLLVCDRAFKRKEIAARRNGRSDDALSNDATDRKS
jgi:hypothetical protein